MQAPRFTREELRRALSAGVLIGLWVAAPLLAIEQVTMTSHHGWIGIDAHAYWVAFRSAHPYVAPPQFVDAFEYSPLFKQVGYPLGRLPFHMYFGLWLVVEGAIYLWITREIAWRWRIPLLLLCVPELELGNLYALFSVVLVLGFRVPELWFFPALTKITPAGTGLVWFLGRGEWHKAIRAVVATVLLVAVSAAAQPRLWAEWFRYLHANGSGSLTWIIVRCLISALATLLAARRGWAWVLPYAFIFCAPVQGGFAKDFAMLPATVHLWMRCRGSEAAAT